MPTDKPRVNLNLDALENEGRPEPFAFVLGGQRFTALDPTEVDWQTVADLDATDLRGLLAVFLTPEDLERFASVRLPQYKLNRLVGAIQEHYGIGAPGDSVAS